MTTPSFWQTSVPVSLSSFFRLTRLENETEFSLFNRKEYEAFKLHPDVVSYHKGPRDANR